MPNIAQLVGGGDTKHDLEEAKSRTHSTALLRTRTQELLDIPKLRARVQTRLVFETLGIPLSEYQTSLSLVTVIRDATLGKCHGASSTIHMP